MENHILRPVEGNPLAFKTANNKASSDEKFHSYINFKFVSNSPGSEENMFYEVTIHLT